MFPSHASKPTEQPSMIPLQEASEGLCVAASLHITYHTGNLEEKTELGTKGLRKKEANNYPCLDVINMFTTPKRFQS